MKVKTGIAGLFLVAALAFSGNFSSAQDEKEGTFIEEAGEKQDSIKGSDIMDFEGEFDQSKSSTGLIIGIIAAVVAVGGVVIYLTRKKKS